MNDSQEAMSREEAFRVIELYQRWNVGQKSMSVAFGGPRTDEDDLLDARRKLLTAAYKVLAPSPQQ